MLYLPRRCFPGFIDIKGNIYSSSDSLWYILWSCTFRSFVARAGGEEEEEEEEEEDRKKKNKIDIFAVKFFDSYEG